ncbi:MAG TPA: hypothetical protein VHM70_18515 [Polyangiaceae bacterium]|jgi:hypothetical protein|nr:hypothetical protein [Polyangiaceae bacterium]
MRKEHLAGLSVFLLAFCALFGWSSTAHAERTRYFELQPMGGYSWVNMTGFSEHKFRQDFDPTKVDKNDPVNSALKEAQVPVRGQGPSVGGALQLKLWVFVLGARYAYSKMPDFGLHTVGADLGLRLGGIVSVYGRLGPGWAFQSGVPDGINTQGFVVSASGGLEIQVAKPISIGLGLDTDLLLLTRSGQLAAVGSAATGGLTTSNIQALDGSAVGFQLRPQLHLTWHI